MSREEARRENARRLANLAGGKAEFARLLVMDPTQVSQLIGPNPTKNIGNSIARRIELAFRLQAGALDNIAPESLPSDNREGAPKKASAPEVLADALKLTCETAEELQLLSVFRLANKDEREAISMTVEAIRLRLRRDMFGDDAK